MKIEDYRDYTIFDSDGHGKATKGTKKTTSIQVRQYMQEGYLLLKSISYPVGDLVKRKAAIEKARKYIDESFE